MNKLSQCRFIFFFVFFLACVNSLPVKEKKTEEGHEEDKEENKTGEDWELNLEYGRYLKEVVQALESDPEFRKKLESSNVDDIKSGKIARELNFVDHNIRTKLDELKRRELERLRHLAVQEHEREVGVDRSRLKIPVHIDHRNPTRFEVEDLRKLIVKTTSDLEQYDKQRQEDFKKYELEKEFSRHQKLSELPEEQRKTLENQHEAELKKHGDHPKLHHPGSKQQLEQVWEEQDHMSPEDFDPKTFFHLHDLDSNGYWDEMEVKALFRKELDKMYDPNAPEDDLNERYEEMERMREHVFRESDQDHDNLISFNEFLDQAHKAEFEKDEGWEGLDEQEVYSKQEYEAYEKQRQLEIHQLIESGAIPPPPGYHPPVVPVQPVHYQAVPPHGNVAYNVPVAGAYNAPIAGAYNAPIAGAYDAPIAGAYNVPVAGQHVPYNYQNVQPGVPQGYQNIPQGYQAVPQGHQVVQEVPHNSVALDASDLKQPQNVHQLGSQQQHLGQQYKVPQQNLQQQPPVPQQNAAPEPVVQQHIVQQQPVSSQSLVAEQSKDPSAGNPAYQQPAAPMKALPDNELGGIHFKHPSNSISGS